MQLQTTRQAAAQRVAAAAAPRAASGVPRSSRFGRPCQRHAVVVAPRTRVAQVAPPSTQQHEQREQHEPSAVPAGEGVGEAFCWTKNWFPVAAVENLLPDKPNKFTLLGRDYILWQDAAGTWRCFADRCPHRLATLSDGFVDKQRGEVVCAYHGWSFGPDGACRSIPQALDAASAATACASKRSCAAAFPTASAGGLLWVWPDAAPTAAADAAAAPVPLVPQLADERFTPLKGRFFMRELPYSWDFLFENLLDPSHVDYAHHSVAGFDAHKAVPLDLKLLEDNGPRGFKFQTLPSDPSRRGAIVEFKAPCLVTILPGPDPVAPPKQRRSGGAGDVRPGSEDPNVLTSLVFYALPSRPGRTLFHGVSWVTDRQQQPIKALSLFTSALPTWLKHVLGFEFFAGDDVFLAAAAKQYVSEGSDWRRLYYLATPADAAITKLRQWLDRFSGGAIPFPAEQQSADVLLANLTMTREQAMDRYSQHVQHCSACKAALARIRAIAAAAAAVAVASLAGAAVAASVRASAALAPDTVPAWLLAAASWGAPAVLGLAGPLLLVGLLAAGACLACRQLQQLFYYRPFERPTWETPAKA